MDTARYKLSCLLQTASSMFTPAVYGVSCEDLWHPDTGGCGIAGLEFLGVCSIKAVKIYTALYLLPQLLKHKAVWEGLKATFPDTLRSATFLTCHCFVTCAAHCVLRRVLGHYRAVTVAFIPSVVGSLISISIEKHNRQEILAIYMASLSLECLYEMAVYRHFIPQIQYGEVALFALSSAVLCHFHRNKEIKINDTMDWLLSKILSCTECSASPKHLVTRLRETITSKLDGVIRRQGGYYRSAVCDHDTSCLAHTVNTALNGLVWGTIIQMCLRLLSSGGSLRQVIRLLAKPAELARVSTFVGLYSASVVGVECVLCGVGGERHPLIPAAAGSLAGLLFTMMPAHSGPVALYFFCRAFQCVYKKLVQDEIIREIPYDRALLFTLSTAITIHTGVCEPHLMRPSYTAFLNYLTDNKYRTLDRDLISVVMNNTLNQDFNFQTSNR